MVIILLLFGALFGIISSVAGIGGGALYMSVMILFFAIPINEARDTSTFIILLFSCATSIFYYRQKRVDLKISLIFAGSAFLGSITSTILFIIFPIDNIALKVIIATVVLISGGNMIRKAILNFKKERDNKSNNLEEILEFTFQNFDSKTNFKKGMPLFFLAGFFAYLAGIGGGMVFVPILSNLFEMPIHFTTATSTTMIFFLGIYNAGVRMVIGEIHYLVGILIAIGTIIGSLLGTKISKKIPKVALQFLVAGVLIALAIRMYFV
ncbi:MAG: sulfite exporter TauE/SafE family protein [Promethearchaeota archaeon]